MAVMFVIVKFPNVYFSLLQGNCSCLDYVEFNAADPILQSRNFEKGLVVTQADTHALG